MSFYAIYSLKEMSHTYKYRKSSVLLPNHEMTLIGQFIRKVTSNFRDFTEINYIVLTCICSEFIVIQNM